MNHPCEKPVPRQNGEDVSDPPAVFPQVDLRGVRFQAITEETCVRRIHDELDAGRGGWLVTPNVHILRRCCRGALDRSLVEKADLVVADGMPLIWASRLQRTPLPGRVAGSNLISSVSAEAARRGRSVYLLGGYPGTAEVSRDVLLQRHGDLDVRGVHCPEFGFEKNPQSVEEMRLALHEAKPDIVFVGLSFPKGELLIDQFREEFPGTWWVGVGVAFSFVSGHVRRAPPWMQNTGIEWIHRVWQEPKRLAKRYFVEGIPFALVLLAAATVRRYKRA